MTTAEPSNAAAKRRPWWRRAAAVLLLLLYRTVGTLTILAALFVLFAQTDMFRHWFRDTVLDLVNEQLEGRLTAGDVRVDLFHGIVVEYPVLYAHGTRLLAAEELSVTYDLAALFARVASINQIKLTRPEIKLIRTDDGVWNYTRIVKPSTDTTASDPLDGTILLRQLWVDGAHVWVHDRTTEPWSTEHFDPSHLELDNLDLSLSARVGLTTHDAAIAINGLTFEQVNGPIDVQQLHAVVHATPDGVDIQSVHVELPRSSVWVRGRIDGVDVMGDVGDSLLLKHPLVAHVTTDRFNPEGLHYFAADVELSGEYALDADVVYSGNELDVTNMSLRGGTARIFGRCKVSHLEDGKPIALDISLRNSTARYADVRERLVFVPLPELDFLQTAEIEYLHLTGEPDHKLSFEIKGRDHPGAFEGSMTLILDKPTLGYDVDMQIRNGDLSVFDDDDEDLRTKLNGRVMMVGSGVTLQELSGTTQIELNRSMVFGRQVKAFRSIIHSNGSGILKVDTLYADLTPYLADSLDPSEDIYSLTSLEPRQIVALNGELDVQDPDVPRYYTNVQSENLNLARLFRDPSLPSILTSRFIINARGMDLDGLYGSMDGRVDMLLLADRGLMPFDLDLTSIDAGSRRIIKVKSGFGSISIDGEFKPSNLIDAIGVSVGAVGTVISDRIAHLSTVSQSSDSLAIDLEPFSAFIDIDLKEASPLNLFLPDLYVSGLARMQARVQSSEQALSVDLRSLYFDGVQISGDSLEFYADPTSARAQVEISGLDQQAQVDRLVAEVTCDSLMIVNGTVLRYPRVRIDESAGTSSISASSGIDDMAFSVAADLTAGENKTIVALDSASFTLNPDRNLSWRLLSPARIELSNGIATINDLSVIRLNGETVTVNGQISEDSFNGARVKVTDFPMRDIPLFADLGPNDPIRLLRGMVTTAEVTVNGTWDEPEIDLDLTADGVSYNRALIGTLNTSIRHRNKVVTATASISDPAVDSDIHTLDLNIRSLPLDLAFTEVEERLVGDQPIDIDLEANQLVLTAVEPFLPAVESVRGNADAEITVRGTPNDIKLAGTAHFENGRFLASSTNLVYKGRGAIHLDNNVLHIDSVLIQNTDRDLRGGAALAHGAVVFDGLAADSIDFTMEARGRRGVKLMSSASQARSPDLYGDLIVQTGTRPIRLYGKLDQPKLEGDMVIQYADVIFPEERSATKARRTSFKYVRQDPRVYGQKSIMDYVREGSTQTQPDQVGPVVDTAQAAKAFVVNTIAAIASDQDVDFVDALDFDLDIYLEGRTLMTMVFGQFEILKADLEQVDRNVPLTFTGSFGDESTNLRGTVRVKEGASVYQFYKPFTTSGELNFNYGGLTNPTLNLKAIHEDRRTINERIEEYKVELTITGTKKKPSISYRVWRMNREIVGDSAQIAGDALMLILVGRTQDELFQEGQGDFVGQVNSAFSAVATSALSDVVRDIGVIQSAALEVGSDVSQSRLTVSGQLFGDVSYRVSGQISDFSGNSTFTISLPLSVLADEEALRYLRADFSSTVNNTGNITRQTRLWEIKLGARLP